MKDYCLSSYWGMPWVRSMYFWLSCFKFQSFLWKEWKVDFSVGLMSCWSFFRSLSRPPNWSYFLRPSSLPLSKLDDSQALLSWSKVFNVGCLESPTLGGSSLNSLTNSCLSRDMSRVLVILLLWGNYFESKGEVPEVRASLKSLVLSDYRVLCGWVVVRGWEGWFFGMELI